MSSAAILFILRGETGRGGAGPLLQAAAPGLTGGTAALNIAVVGAPTRPAGFGPGRVESILLARFADAGYARVEPPILQDASTFLDLGGEDIRARLLLLGDTLGAELCLRPEYTIPACRDHLASAQAGRAAALCYCGPVFRAREGAAREFVQAGIESFGRTDTAAADAEILALTLEAAGAAGAAELRVVFGDAGLFRAVLDAIGVPPLWQRRLRRGLERGQPLDAVLRGASQAPGRRSGVMAALAGADNREARALVEDLLSIAGISTVGGRSVGEIAERFLDQVGQGSAGGLDGERRALLDRFLAIAGDPDEASARLRSLARDADLDLEPDLDLFDDRIGFMAAQGLDVGGLAFKTVFGRSLDYYTGFVFEAATPGAPTGEPLAGGGRYDGLAQALGSAARVPAVGASIWVERLGAGGP